MNNKSQIIKNNAKGVTTKVLTTLNKPKNIKIISYVLLALVFLGIVGYQYIFDYVKYLFYTEKPKDYKHTTVMGKIKSDEPTILDESDMVKPLDGINYTLGFWINITDFYQDHTYWRHVLHKGTVIKKCQTLDYNYWENILGDINQQSPGIWLHPDKNTIRLCFTTEVTKEYDSPKDAHTFSSLPILEVKKENVFKRTIEYCDIDNIPVRELTNIIFTVNKQQVTIYVNGRLVKYCNLQGEPYFNNGKTYVSFNKSYKGYLNGLTYIPQLVSRVKIDQLSKTVPIDDDN